MRFFCPREINGNRGDLASRIGILLFLQREGISDVTVCCRRKVDISPTKYESVPYGYLYNFIPSMAGIRALLRSHAVLWTCGLDLQDDSSLLKLVHTFIVFLSYKLLGKRIYVLNQGAGPVERWSGVLLTKLILSLTDLFIARDSKTYHFLSSVNPKARLVLARDGIFTSAFDEVLSPRNTANNTRRYDMKSPLIGFNIRLWHHFSSSLLPYHCARKSYENRGAAQMEKLVSAAITFCTSMIKNHNASILLFSMYEAEVDAWENEETYLLEIKNAIKEQIEIVDTSIGLEEFCNTIKLCNVMVGMRLHSALLALRMGVPAITISYTLKGTDIFSDLGLKDWVFDLTRFENYPLELVPAVCNLLNEKPPTANIQNAIERNDMVIKRCIEEMKCAR